VILECTSSFLHASNGRCGRDEQPFRFLLNDCEQRVELFHASLGLIDRSADSLVSGIDGLVELRDVRSDGGRDEVQVVGNGVRIRDDRRNVVVNALEQLVELLIRRPEPPRDGNRDDDERQQRERHDRTRRGRQLLEQTAGGDLLRDDRVPRRCGDLEQQVSRERQHTGHRGMPGRGK